MTYVCPTDQNEVLYRDRDEDPMRVRLAQIPADDEPQECPKCHVWYFKHECKQVP